jgi:hypothetical protein
MLKKGRKGTQPAKVRSQKMIETSPTTPVLLVTGPKSSVMLCETSTPPASLPKAQTWGLEFRLLISERLKKNEVMDQLSKASSTIRNKRMHAVKLAELPNLPFLL